MEARTACEAAGMRLCSLHELASGACCGSGCALDYQYVWSAEACSQRECLRLRADHNLTTTGQLTRLFRATYGGPLSLSLALQRSYGIHGCHTSFGATVFRNGTGRASCDVPIPRWRWPAERSQAAISGYAPGSGHRTRDVFLPTSCDVYAAVRLDLLDAGAALVPSTRLLHGSHGAAWYRLGTSLQAGGSVHLLVLGGSMTSGAGCAPDLAHPTSRDCAFASRFGRALEELVQQAIGRRPRVRVSNLAQSAMNTAGSLTMLPILLKTALTDEQAGTPTLVLADFSANDAFDKECAPATEALVRYVLGSLSSVALLLSKAIPSTCSYDFAATRYGVPVVSFERVINDGRIANAGTCGQGKAKQWHPPCEPHPAAASHEIFSKVLLASVVRVLLHVSTHPPADLSVTHLPAPTSATVLDRFRVCDSPLASYSRMQPQGARVMQGNFSYYEDRPGKPGAPGIANQCGNSNLLVTPRSPAAHCAVLPSVAWQAGSRRARLEV